MTTDHGIEAETEKENERPHILHFIGAWVFALICYLPLMLLCSLGFFIVGIATLMEEIHFWLRDRWTQKADGPIWENTWQIIKEEYHGFSKSFFL